MSRFAFARISSELVWTVICCGSRSVTSSELDMDRSVVFVHGDGAQADARIRRMGARHDPELVAVPGTDDARVGFVPGEAGRYAGRVELLDDRGQQRALAHGTALMRAAVLVRVQPSVDAEHADRRVLDVHDE